ncbi:MAG: hypothetical protein ACLFVJ_23625 [Persicimonas sp.]
MLNLPDSFIGAAALVGAVLIGVFAVGCDRQLPEAADNGQAQEVQQQPEAAERDGPAESDQQEDTGERSAPRTSISKSADQLSDEEDRAHAKAVGQGYKGCLEEFGVDGEIEAYFIIWVKSDGTVADVQTSSKLADPLKDCLLKHFGNKRIDGFSGEPAQVNFLFSGTYTSPRDSLAESWSLTRRSELRPEGKQRLDEAIGERN